MRLSRQLGEIPHQGEQRQTAKRKNDSEEKTHGNVSLIPIDHVPGGVPPGA
jgi:hypothetical protein